MKRIVLLAAMAGALWVSAASAADKMTALTYNFSIPGTNMDDYISDTSFIGFELSGRQYMNRERPFMVGLSAGWEVFDQETSGTINALGVDITGNQHRYINAFPLMVTLHAYFGPRDGTQFYVGTGVGAFYFKQQFDIGVYTFDEGTWQFGVVPEVGVQVPLSGYTGSLLVNAKYNYAVASGESLSGDSVAWDYLGINVGFAWTRW